MKYDGTNTIVLDTGGVSYINGNLALGTTSAFTTGGTSRLSLLASSVLLSAGISNNDMFYIRRQSAGNFAWQTYDTGNGGNIQLQPYGGNVGIGTVTPNSPLHVHADGIGIRLDGTANTTRKIFFRSTSTTNPAEIYADGTLRLWTEDAGTDIKLEPADDILMNPGGNVGIGTTSPAGKLHVLGTGGTSSTIQLESTGSGNTVFYMKGQAGSDWWGMFTGSSGGGLTLKDETNNKDAFIARPQGKLSYPSQTRFSAYSNNSSTSYSAGQAFVMNLVRDNINNRYNTANGIFTADITGLYQFRFNAYTYSSGQWSVLYWDGNGLSYFRDNGTTLSGDHSVLCTVTANSIHHMAWTMHLDSGKGCAVGWRSGYSGNIYRSHAQFSGELISAD